MLINGSHLIGFPVLSLHVGGEIARVSEVIINPDTLKVIAFRVEGPLVGRDEVGDILPVDSIREVSALGFIIDSIDELVDGEEIVRIKEVLALNFTLPGLKVVTKKREKLGKVSEYIVIAEDWQIHQLIVQRPLMKSFLDPELTIPRSRIVEVNDYEVIVRSEKERTKTKAKADTPADFIPNFVNPFREPDFAPDTRIDRK